MINVVDHAQFPEPLSKLNRSALLNVVAQLCPSMALIGEGLEAFARSGHVLPNFDRLIMYKLAAEMHRFDREHGAVAHRLRMSTRAIAEYSSDAGLNRLRQFVYEAICCFDFTIEHSILSLLQRHGPMPKAEIIEYLKPRSKKVAIANAIRYLKKQNNIDTLKRAIRLLNPTLEMPPHEGLAKSLYLGRRCREFRKGTSLFAKTWKGHFTQLVCDDLRNKLTTINDDDPIKRIMEELDHASMKESGESLISTAAVLSRCKLGDHQDLNASEHAAFAIEMTEAGSHSSSFFASMLDNKRQHLLMNQLPMLYRKYDAVFEEAQRLSSTGNRYPYQFTLELFDAS